jgi:hypothetical protein
MSSFADNGVIFTIMDQYILEIVEIYTQTVHICQAQQKGGISGHNSEVNGSKGQIHRYRTVGSLLRSVTKVDFMLAGCFCINGQFGKLLLQGLKLQQSFSGFAGCTGIGQNTLKNLFVVSTVEGEEVCWLLGLFFIRVNPGNGVEYSSVVEDFGGNYAINKAAKCQKLNE